MHEGWKRGAKPQMKKRARADTVILGLQTGKLARGGSMSIRPFTSISRVQFEQDGVNLKRWGTEKSVSILHVFAQPLRYE